jgi:broad specificity phosphatase PhoE
MTPAATPASLWLIRHGESQGNLADLRAQAARAERLDLDVRDADVELSDAGREQARSAGRMLAAAAPGQRPGTVISSPFRRAAETARIAVETSGIDVPVRRDERLRERDLGVFDGLTRYGITARFPEEAERRARVGKLYYRPPSGEAWVDVVLRVRAFLDTLNLRHPGEHVAVFTHQAVIMAFRYVLEELDEADLLAIDAGSPIANCSVTRYLGSEGRLVLDVFNDVEHIEAGSAPVTEEREGVRGV